MSRRASGKMTFWMCWTHGQGERVDLYIVAKKVCEQQTATTVHEPSRMYWRLAIVSPRKTQMVRSFRPPLISFVTFARSQSMNACIPSWARKT